MIIMRFYSGFKEDWVIMDLKNLERKEFNLPQKIPKLAQKAKCQISLMKKKMLSMN